ncbi:MAG: dimethylhistidine N-methyltransferase [Alphaproteobacteria bacterium]|jgi:dimethylhistidine N-methyltransferase
MNSSVAAQIIEAMDAQTAAFRADVIAGLSEADKLLPSRWLYDDRGSDLFEQITKLPEYYPTRTETGILTSNAQSLAAFCGQQAVIIEYGAGASIKSQILLNALRQPRMYVPVDIAGDFLAAAAERLRKRFPALEVLPVAADFTQEFDLPNAVPAEFKRTGFFPGSTIGNLAPEEAISFLSRVHRHVTDRQSADPQPGRTLIGIDLKKSTDVLIPAYDDAAGVTAAFNLNLLRRINRELGGTFKLDQFQHEARWNDAASSIEMHIVSSTDQTVVAAGKAFDFAEGETIHTESSRKYSQEGFAAIAADAGWRVTQTWTDSDDLFAIVGLETL